MNRNLFIGVIVLVLLLVGAYFVFVAGKNKPQSNQAPQAQTPTTAADIPVSIVNFSFSPAVITVKKGTKVIWTNNDTTVHTVNSAEFSSPQLKQGDTYSYTFDQPGTFAYNCGIHPNMKGTITVQ